MLGQRMILERFGKSLRLVKFTWSMLIAPWPPFAVFLAATAVLGALVPIVTVRVTTELIDSLGYEGHRDRYRLGHSVGRSLPLSPPCLPCSWA